MNGIYKQKIALFIELSLLQISNFSIKIKISGYVSGELILSSKDEFS